MTAPGIERRLEALRASGRAPRRGGPAPHRDRGHGRPAPAHPPGHRRAAAARDAPGAVQRGPREARAGSPRSPTVSKRCSGSSCPGHPRRWPRPPASPPTTSARLARDFAAAPSAVGLRPRGHVHPGVRRPRHLARQRAQRRDRQPRPARRRHVHAPRGRSAGPRRSPRPARALRQGPEPRAWPARVQRRATPWPPSPRRSRRRATGQVRALVTLAGNPVLSTPNGGAARPGPREARLHGLDRLLRERDHAARAPHPAADLRPRARRTTTSCSTPSPCATRSATRRRSSRGRRARFTTGRSCSSWPRASRPDGGTAWRPPSSGGRFAPSGPRASSICSLRLGPYGTVSPVPSGPEPWPRRRRRPTASTSARCDRRFPSAWGRKDRRIDLAPAKLVADVARLEARRPSLSRLERPPAHRPPRAAQQQLVDAQQRAPGEGPRPLHAPHAPRRRAGPRPQRRRARARDLPRGRRRGHRSR